MRIVHGGGRSASLFATAVVSVVLLAGCYGGNGNVRDDAGNAYIASRGILPPLKKAQVFNLDGELSATIWRTTNGVPHILADNLESVAFGSGYAQARDNTCLIAAVIVRATSRRSQYFGPGPNNRNIISDFSYKALRIMPRAREAFPGLSPISRAMLSGFAAGYNQFLADSTPADLSPRCAGAPWVQPITPQQLFASMIVFVGFGSNTVFVHTRALFNAVPPGEDPAPSLASAPTGPRRVKARLAGLNEMTPRTRPPFSAFTHKAAGSNGWAIGGKLTESGRGALLANPHFPYTGPLRFYQLHLIVPGVIDVMGASLIGFPVPMIGFNKHVAWTHTVTPSRQFTIYRLKLKGNGAMAYMKDGRPHPITSETYTIKVDTGNGEPVTLKRTFYYSGYGPMLNLHTVSPAFPTWGKGGVAFTYRDANATTARQIIDQWLAMGRSDNLKEFKSVFRDCGSVFWVNTMYADMAGNAFYIDGSAVPNLSDAALAALKRRLSKSRAAKIAFRHGLTILDGSTSRDEWVSGECGRGLVPYKNVPKLLRHDFVQNSNDTYWATNPEHPMTGYSILYGRPAQPLPMRTRMGLTMLTQRTDPGLSTVAPAGPDGKFSARELIEMLYSNRAFMAEMLLDDILRRCELIGREPVEYAKGRWRPVAKGCKALARWNGVFETYSRGAATFRVFVGHYRSARLPEAFTVPFDPAHPIHTPRQPQPADPDDLAHDSMLVALARGLNVLDSVNIAYDVPLGRVQRVVQSTSVGPGETPSVAATWPWPGGIDAVEGAFNVAGLYDMSSVFALSTAIATRFPVVHPPDRMSFQKTGALSTKPGQGWVVVGGTSWHFGLMFTDDGPVAYGLLSYSQSTDSTSPHFSDQHERYSNENYRKIRFTKEAIFSDPNLSKTVITQTH